MFYVRYLPLLFTTFSATVSYSCTWTSVTLTRAVVAYCRTEKEKQQMKVELDDIHTQLEHAAKSRASFASFSELFYC